MIDIILSEWYVIDDAKHTFPIGYIIKEVSEHELYFFGGV